ncbi:hypothetical protein EVA_09440 [gut metagenome]|uniref:Uncharacterized protein n=1 Tax=gut metagenome TaxID=749906 RepID=J9G6E3_9ZZZZ
MHLFYSTKLCVPLHCYPIFLTVIHPMRNSSRKSSNPFAYKADKRNRAKKATGKRVGKSRPEKANNQLNRRVK